MCRVKKFEFAKETAEYVRSEMKALEEELKEVNNTVVFLPSGEVIFVTPQLACTLLDGKVRAFLTNTSSFAVCTICKCPPSKMNDLENLGRFKINPASLQYGLSVLHLYIRLLEALLHISYKAGLPEDKYRASKQYAPMIAERKIEIQARFSEKFGYEIDKPGPNGGTSTTGKIARTAFSRPEDLANVLEIDVELIQRLRTLLLAISSGLPIDTQKFGEFASETAKVYIKNYKKFPMTTTLHTLLIHGAEIIDNCIVPVGMLSEEAAESKNKYYRRDRIEHARKDTREHNMIDVFTRALHMSDPKVSQMTLKEKVKKKVHQELPDEVKGLLLLEDEDDDTTIMSENFQDPDARYLESLDEMCIENENVIEKEIEMEIEYEREYIQN